MNNGGDIKAQTFKFHELAAATNNFKSESLLGEGGFGRVYKGCLQKTNEVPQSPYIFSFSEHSSIIDFY